MAYQTFTQQNMVGYVCYDLAHQIRWAKHSFSVLVVGVISHLWCAARLVGIAHHSFYSVDIFKDFWIFQIIVTTRNKQYHTSSHDLVFASFFADIKVSLSILLWPDSGRSSGFL